MELELSSETAEPGTADDRQTTEHNANSTPDSNMKSDMKSRESEIMLYNSEYLKNNYEKYIRDDFLYAFGSFYCDKEMKIPVLDPILKTKCYHPETELNYSHCEFATYMKNIVAWVDTKLNYLNGESSKCNTKTKFKTGYVKIGQQTTRISLNCKALDLDTGSQEQNKKLKSETNSQNEIITSPDITTAKHDIPESSTNDQKKGINMVNNTQDEMITSPAITSPKHDILGSSTSNHETEIAMENIQTKITTSSEIISPKHNLAGSSINYQNKKIDMVNNTPDEILTSLVITYPKHDIPGGSTNAHKIEIAKENMQSEKITSPKHNFTRSSTKDYRKRINKIKSNLVNISSTFDSIQTDLQFKNPVFPDNVKESTPKNLKKSTNDKVLNEDEFYSAQTSFDTIIDEEVSSLCLKTSSTPVRNTRGNKQTSKKLDKTPTTLLNRSNSVTDSEHSPKKKKIEKPSPSYVEQKITTNINHTNPPAITSQKYDVPGCSTNNHETEIAVENIQTKIITTPEIISPKHNLAGSSAKDYRKRTNKIKSNLVNISSTFHSIQTDSQFKNPVFSDNVIKSTPKNLKKSTNDKVLNEDEFESAQTSFDTIIDEEVSSLCLKTSSTPVRNTRGNKQTSKKLDKTPTTLLNRSNSVTDSEHSSKKKKIEKPSPSYVEQKITTNINHTNPPATTSQKYDVPGCSTNNHETEIAVENIQTKIITSPEIISPKHNLAGSSAKDYSKRTNKINSNLVNISSIFDSLQTDSQFKNPVFPDDVKESTPKNLKKITNDKVLNEDEFYSAQTSFDTIIDKEVSSLCLKTSSTPVRNTRGNKQTSKKLDKTPTTLLKRSNSVTDSEHSSKKKKIEKPSPSNVERKTTTNNNKNSVKVLNELALNESIKQVIKNVYCRNSKGETKLHSACAKGKLNLVTSLLEDGFNPNVKDNAGWTPMHEAVKSGSLDIVQELIKYGAYLNVPGFEYESPLYTAIKYGKFEIAITLLKHGADANFINMYGNNARDLNEEKLSELLEKQVSCISTQICLSNYALDEIVIVLNNVSLKSETVNTFCKQFNIKLVQNIMNEKKLAQVTHMIVSKTKNNTCDVNLECLIGIANGLFIINENWISDSLDKNKLVKCENYEVSGTQFFADCNGPNTSRISKQKLNPKLFDGMNIHISGTIGWEQFSLEHLKKLIVEFGAKLLIRMPNPENCPTNITPYHCRNNDQMFHVSNIILYTMDSNRLIKYNMKHLKAFHISWFMEAVQKYYIM